jgi:hypothetical protein
MKIALPVRRSRWTPRRDRDKVTLLTISIPEQENGLNIRPGIHSLGARKQNERFTQTLPNVPDGPIYVSHLSGCDERGQFRANRRIEILNDSSSQPISTHRRRGNGRLITDSNVLWPDTAIVQPAGVTPPEPNARGRRIASEHSIMPWWS